MHSPRSDLNQRKIFESEQICFHCFFFNHFYVLLHSMGLSGGNQPNISDNHQLHPGPIYVRIYNSCSLPARNWSMPSPILPWSKTTIEILSIQAEKSLMQVSSEVAALEDLSAGLN
jgi:hypothetical protein